ncbi:PKD domain-containing protein [Anaeromyxobacter oryzae]|uniref:PKD/Chitinase domain-containing protein n=1 Tax=Anaeromyxobacter oryzae TaxID=2918170 RepID=A0ABM7X0P2_9BACT|nr:dickkopf-related protein [Anaeromyxobacter oryzae]BDG05270.1 hypothetical protein AMOR_42660 [Anaeromyxobacter oryzae]
MRLLCSAAVLGLLLSGCAGGGTSSTPPACKGVLSKCSTNGDCCTNTCFQGYCMGSDAGGACATTPDCAPGLLCKSRVCKAATCRDDGDVCSLDAECCVGNCSLSHRCAANAAPVARVGGDRSATKRVAIVLDASGSTDPDGDPLTYEWSLAAPAGSAAALSSTATATTGFTTDVVGTYTATVTVRDPTHASTATVHVSVANTPPVADAGAARTVSRNRPVTLDASASSDVDHDPLTFSWTLAGPAGSSATLSGASTASPTFTPDREGPYTATVTVGDGTATTQAFVVITSVNAAPVPVLAAPYQVNAADAVGLDASGSTDDNLDPLTYAWTLEPPAGSGAALSAATGPASGFTTDVEGSYLVHLDVSDGIATTRRDWTVHALRHVWKLPHDVVHAEYDRAHDRIVAVSASPRSSLWILDPATETEVEVALPGSPPRGLGVAPDGNAAVVPRMGAATLVDLATHAVTTDCATTWLDAGATTRVPYGGAGAALGDLINVGKGQGTPTRLAWLAPGSGSPGDAMSIDMTSCALSQLTYPGLMSPGEVRLRPSGSSVYFADASYGNEFVLYSSTSATQWQATCSADTVWESFWFYDDGSRLLEASGIVYDANPDTTYGAAFATLSAVGYVGSSSRPDRVNLVHADASTVAGVIAAIPKTPWGEATIDDQLRTYGLGDFLEQTASRITLPALTVGGSGQLSHGRFVWHRSDAAKRFVLLYTDGGRWGLATYP